MKRFISDGLFFSKPAGFEKKAAGFEYKHDGLFLKGAPCFFKRRDDCCRTF
ncbi:hypothetical protein JCM10003_3643 [Bacteroides pyogenes JCM 10003]|nr:hypothetical protein JCM10003_3643 [Bacteroides pyogenes JCM 10003]